jgi:hypothetical protein
MIKPLVHHPEYVELIHILEPLLRRYPPLVRMRFDDLTDWMAWYWNRGTMTCVITGRGEPLGVCLIKLFRELEQFMDHDAHEPCGKFAFIELSIAQDGRIMGQMLEEMESRWGPQEIVMWDRGARTENGVPRMYRWNQFRKLARRLSQYGITENA